MDTNLQSINERIAEKIGSELIDLIPIDQWQAMVDVEIKRFTVDVAPKIIQQILADKYKETARAHIEQYTTTQDWNELTQTYNNKALEELLAASGGVIFAGVMGPAMQQVIAQLRNNIY